MCADGLNVRRHGKSKSLILLFAGAALLAGVVAVRGAEIDVSKLKPGDKLEYNDHGDEWVTVEYTGKGPTSHTVMVKRPPFREPVSTPLSWLRMPAKAKSAVVRDPNNPFATEEERSTAVKSRTWNDKSGKFKIEGTLQKVDGDKVVLRRSDDQEITVPLDKLSDADLKYIADFKAGKLPASEIAETPVSKEQGPGLTETNLNAAKVLDLSDSDGWNYKPDVVPDTDKMRSGRVTLQPFTDFWDKPQRILLLPKEKKAFVVSLNEGPGSDEKYVSRVQLCNLENGKMESAGAFGQGLAPLDVSPDGALVLARTEGFGTGKKNELYLYTRDGNKVKATKAWRPYGSAGHGSQDDVTWAAFTDPNHVLTLNGSGVLALWQVPVLKPIYAASLTQGVEPGFSAARKYIAVGSKAGITILNVTNGAVVGVLPVDKEGVSSGALAISEDGSRVALWQSGRIRVWDLQNQQLLRDFALQGRAAGFPKGLAFTSNNYLLLNGQAVVDVERRIPIWNYTNVGESAVVRDGKVWFLDDGLVTGGKVLSASTLPHRAALDAVANLKPEDLLVLRPGLEVSLDLQISGEPQEVEAAKKAIEDRLKKNGMKIVPQSNVRLVGAVQPGKSQKIRYRNWRQSPFSGGTEHEVATQVLSLGFQVGRETVWKHEVSTHPPYHLQLNEGEGVDQALQRVMKVQEDSYLSPKRLAGIWLPAYLAKMPGDAAQN